MVLGLALNAVRCATVESRFANELLGLVHSVRSPDSCKGATGILFPRATNALMRRPCVQCSPGGGGAELVPGSLIEFRVQILISERF